MSRSLSKYRVYILCEDTVQYHFIRGFLLAQGIKSNRQIFLFTDLPEGSQSAEQFVRENFLDGFRAYARNQENVLFVVAQDIDFIDRKPEDARREMESILKDNGLEGIKKTDKLLLIYPKRNIETWFEWLQMEHLQNTVDESRDYKLKHRHAKPKELGEKASKLFDKGDPDICDSAPASIVYACKGFADLCLVLEDMD